MTFTAPSSAGAVSPWLQRTHIAWAPPLSTVGTCHPAFIAWHRLVLSTSSSGHSVILFGILIFLGKALWGPKCLGHGEVAVPGSPAKSEGLHTVSGAEVLSLPSLDVNLRLPLFQNIQHWEEEEESWVPLMNERSITCTQRAALMPSLAGISG